MPEVPGIADEDNYHVVNGTLAFEDLWPSQGDYDMNDVVVTYKSTVYKNVLSNRATKVVDRFTLAHVGGTLPCGFGYQFDKLDKAAKPGRPLPLCRGRCSNRTRANRT